MQRHSKKGNIIEAFAVLDTLLEYELLIRWSHFVHGVSWIRESKIFSDINTQRKYLEHVQLLYEIGLINNRERNLFKEFHDARNKVIHEMYHLHKGFKFKKKTLNGKFKSGLKAYAILLRVHEKVLYQFYLPRFDHPEIFDKYKKITEKKLSKDLKQYVNFDLK